MQECGLASFPGHTVSVAWRGVAWHGVGTRLEHGPIERVLQLELARCQRCIATNRAGLRRAASGGLGCLSDELKCLVVAAGRIRVET